jgi:hypothetical protein
MVLLKDMVVLVVQVVLAYTAVVVNPALWVLLVVLQCRLPVMLPWLLILEVQY